MKIKQLDHIVLTVSDFQKSIDFYVDVLGMKADGRALFFGFQKINLHRYAGEFQPAAAYPTLGSADICLLCDGDINLIASEVQAKGVEIELGIVRRNGAQGEMDSIYLRDPDGNLLELSVLCVK